MSTGEKKVSRLPLTADQTRSGYTFVVPSAKVELSTWHYTTTEPDSTWVNEKFDHSQWQEGKSALRTKGAPGTPGTEDIMNTELNTHDIWLRRTVKLPDGKVFSCCNYYIKT